MKEEKIKDILVLGLYKDGEKTLPLTRTCLLKEEVMNLNVLEIAGMAMAVFNTFYSSGSGDKEKFAETFKECFDLMFKERDKYVAKFVKDIKEND